MADGITIRADGFHEMAAAEDVAIWWEREGRQAQRLTGTETLAEMLVKAGMDWEYEARAVRFMATDAAGQRTARKFPGRVILVRSDSGVGLSDVSDRYKVRQPREIAGFFEDLIRQAGYRMNSLGTLHGGTKLWAQADIDSGSLLPGDVQKARLLLADSCDGTMRTTARFVNESVVCANTLSMAMNETGGRSVEVSHRSVFNASAVKKQLGLAIGAFERFMRDAAEMSKCPVSPEDQRMFFATLLGADYSYESLTGPRRDAVSEANEKVMEGYRFKQFMESLTDAGGADLPGRAGTVWGMVNAVTHSIDHKSRGRTVDNRIDSALFGPGSDLKAKAFDAALAILAA